MTVVIFCFAGNLGSKKRWTLKLLVKAAKLHFSYHKPLVVAIKFIDLKCVVATLHKVTAFIDYTTLAQFHKLPRLAHGYLFLPLIAAQPTVERRAFYGEETPIATHTHTGGIPTLAADVTLRYAVTGKSLLLVAVANDEEFTLNLQRHILLLALLGKLHKVRFDETVDFTVHNTTNIRCLEVCTVVLHAAVVEYIGTNL